MKTSVVVIRIDVNKACQNNYLYMKDYFTKNKIWILRLQINNQLYQKVKFIYLGFDKKREGPILTSKCLNRIILLWL